MKEPEYRKWKVTIKEKGLEHPIVSHMYGYYDEADVVKHYGLNQDDVEWYKMEDITDKDE